MIEHYQEGVKTTLVMTPNKSMTWEQNRLILLAMFTVNMIIGIGFAMIGGWLILPFAGLEIMLVGLGMYYVCWKLNFKHIIIIEADSLVLQKGVYFPKQEWLWQKRDTSLLRRPAPYRLSAPDLFLRYFSHTVEIGEFLNRDEKKEVVQALNDLGLNTVRLPKRDK
ncbi:MAG: DUF2244 domain-containing protein [Pseudomonadota bacterium]